MTTFNYIYILYAEAVVIEGSFVIENLFYQQVLSDIYDSNTLLQTLSDEVL